MNWLKGVSEMRIGDILSAVFIFSLVLFIIFTTTSVVLERFL